MKHNGIRFNKRNDIYPSPNEMKLRALLEFTAVIEIHSIFSFIAINVFHSNYWILWQLLGSRSYLGDNLTTWSPSTLDQNVTMHVGDGWGATRLASSEQVAAIVEYLSLQTPF